MPDCRFPLCTRMALEHGFCIQHRIYKDERMPDEKPAKKTAVKKAPKKKNAKRKATDRDYKKIVVEMLLQDKSCHVKSPVCTGRAQGLHHKQKRSPKNMLERSNLIRSCNACNTYLESHTSWGEERGLIISKHKKAEA